MEKIYIETFGCSFNQADSQIMKGLLDKYGFRIVKNPQRADIVIINTCYVKTPTQERVAYRIQNLQKTFPDKKMIVGGCMTEIDPERLEKIASKNSWVGPHRIKNIVSVVSDTLKGKTIRLVGERKDIKVALPKIKDNPLIEIVQICEGCSGCCSYCCTRFARGKLFSYPVKLIVDDVRQALKKGCKEFWITAQDTAAYEFNKYRLPELLNELAKIEGKFFIRVGMMNPMHVKNIVNELIESYKSEKIFKFLHLPVQSGSDHVLKVMNRGYSVKDFKNVVKMFRKKFPLLTLSTDVIVGFPEESNEDFQKTIDLMKEVKPDIVNVSKFGARPRTKAAKMKQLARKIINEQTKKIVELIEEMKLENNKKWLNWEGEVLIDEKGKKGGMIGRNFTYKPILTEGKLGSFHKVKINKVHPTFLVG
jgi:threonylcarbamoyladenosine tRNA methylthiotransferase CDKAL1